MCKYEIFILSCQFSLLLADHKFLFIYYVIVYDLQEHEHIGASPYYLNYFVQVAILSLLPK